MMREKKGSRYLPAVLAAFLMMMYLLVPVAAADSFVSDGAGLFTAFEVQALENAAKEKGEQIGADLVIVTTDEYYSEEGTDHARAYLLDNGYGVGEGREGIIFLININMGKREYTVYEYNDKASGYLLTDYEGDQILDALESDMRDENYYDAAETFLDSCVYYAGVDEGENYPDSQVHEQESTINWGICIVIGLVGGGILTGVLVASRNNDSKPGPRTYMKGKEIQLRREEDRFIRTTVTKRKIEKESSNDSGGDSGGFSGGDSDGGHGGSRSF